LYKAFFLNYSKTQLVGVVFVILMIALIGGLLNQSTLPPKTTAKSDAPDAPTSNAQSPVDNEYKTNYDAGHNKGMHEGINWAKKGWEIPAPIGISAMSTSRADDVKTSRPDVWKLGFQKGFRDGYTSIRPIIRKDKDYDQLSWSNAKVGVRLYNYAEQQEGTLVGVHRSSGLITVKFQNGTIEDKLLARVAPVWFVRKTDERTSPKVDANPYARGEDNELLTKLVIKPFLKSRLNDPDSLQDLQFVNSSAVKGKPLTYKVTLSYRARNGFGALIGYRQTFIMTSKGTGAELADWHVSQ